jgi:hypothetical protein
VADIRMDKGQWFDYFDYDKGGSLLALLAQEFKY